MTQTPFEVSFDDRGRLLIDEEILSRANMKTSMFRGQDISMMEVYARAELTERELWEIAKSDTNFNSWNMAMENIEVHREAVIEALLTLFKALKKALGFGSGLKN